jgi:ABC-type glycerol-3-phosphate transport system substrate-binding protein
MKKTLFLLAGLFLIGSAVFAGGRRSSDGAASAAPSVQAPAGLRQINGGRPVRLEVDLHRTYMPSLNGVPAPEQSYVIVSTQRVADRFMAMYPNVTIEWCYTKVVDSYEWWVTQLAGGTAPAIGYRVNEYYWRYDMTDDLEKPNPFAPQYATWKDQFPAYVWSHTVDGNNRITGLPSPLFPGPATGYYYNVDIFNRLNLRPPANFEELRQVTKALKSAGYNSLGPWKGELITGDANWPFWFTINPGYAAALADQVDYDGDNVFSRNEQLRATRADIFNPVKHEYAREVLRHFKELYTDIYIPGVDSVDIDTLWDSGTLGLFMQGLWDLQKELSNTQRGFKTDVVPPPLITSATSRYVKDPEYSRTGPYQPNPDGVWSIVKQTVDADSGVKEAALAFLQFLMTPENMTDIINEFQVWLSPIRDVPVPALLEGWFSQQFPYYPVPGGYVVYGFTNDVNVAQKSELELWVKGQTPDDVFFTRWNDLMQRSVDDVIRQENVDISGW